MKKFKIVPLTKEYVSRIKETKVDDFNYPVVEQIATGYGPCRISLKKFDPGKDTRLLISHSPFEIKNAFNQPGPIFVHKKEVEPYKNDHQFPPEIKADKQNFPLSLIGYNTKQNMIFTKLVGDDDVDLLIPEIFHDHNDIAYLHARNAEAGCFICKIERV
ncbi:hypothetical protein IWQ47_000500 [Aquimarina sp. EL_43]|uniref:DUF1203 domain-containing protein n=1 Tax=Aquimarina TaxID=290174 RepID=UPI00046F3934|nr:MULTISPECIES: DUF1203 domain-containing protein [Aquimarina]MBG6128808.1 hypothetical protein [Aquimarina sp. EL_35]MBG6149871.1 hypothetical protein [Aquimarina sp. EL_32]MBG6167442.1 hypothetical protein [Aquimarina sp. EL_43]